MNGVSCNAQRISRAEPSSCLPEVAAGFLGERRARRRHLPVHQTFPIHRETPLQPRGAAGHQLHVQRLQCRIQQASSQRMWFYPNAARHQQSGFHHCTKLRFGGDRGGRAHRAAAEPPEQTGCQNLFCQRAARSGDLPCVQAAIRWEAGTDSFHGNRQPAADSTLAHHLPSGFLSQQTVAPLMQSYP